MTKRNTKKALVVSLLSLLLCCSMLIGTTFAWFTDAVTSGNNKIVAGNLDVELEYLVDGAWKPVTENTNVFEENTLWEPGHTEVVYLKVSNLGTLALDYKLGVNIAHETESVNVAGKSFKLSDYIQMAAIKGVTDDYDTREDARKAVTSSKAINEGYVQEGTLYPANNIPTDGVKEEYVCLVVYMPEEVGNEANYATGEAAPEILLGINLYATQETYEKDSFNEKYDETATMPLIGTGSAPVEENTAFVYVEARDMQDGSKPKLASLMAPMSAVADTAENVTISVKKTTLNQEIVITDDQEAVTYDVTVTGLKEGNTTPVQVEITIGSGKSGIKLYHYEEEITDFYYNESRGIISFETTSFSPFSVVYDAEYKAPEITPDDTLPAAVLREYTADELEAANATNADWMDIQLFDGKEVNKGQTLAAAYEFKAPHDKTSIDACTYKDWICDFYVMVKLADGSTTELPAGVLYLAGNYGTWGWIGFTNPTVNTNEYIPMLQSVAEVPWTYADVAVNVGTFQCGVNRAVGYDSSILDGATFVVQLRLVDPTNHSNYQVVSEIPYSFGN